MDSHEKQVVALLSSPAAYPHPVAGIDRRETHVSHVFLAGNYAYKLKKPVKFPFLDASTVALRKKFCQLEISLNRRLARAIYLGIEPIIETPRGLRLGGRGKAIDWVVKMRRLPEGKMLDQLVSRRQVTAQDMKRLADRLGPFFKKAARGRKIDNYGTPKAVGELVLGNLNECQLFVGKLVSEQDKRFIEAGFRQYLTLNEPVLARRAREHRIIDGHGDLRCENICMSEPVAVFDCVEFQPAFRCGDAVNDFAFILMDLEFRGRQDLAQALVNEYRRRVSDPTFERVVTLYKCHRTLVRGKVRGFSWLQHPNTKEGRRIKRFSKAHFELALRYAKQIAPPRLVIVGGIIGTGKSTLARGLSQALGARWLRTDEIRLTEFAKYRKAGQGFAGGIYSARVSNLVYQRLIERTQAFLRSGESVVCDGTFSQAIGRQTLRKLAKQRSASFHFFECVVPKAVALRRIAARYAAKSDISEAQPEHYDRMRSGFEPVRNWPKSDWTKLSDNRKAEETLKAAVAVLRRLWVV